ncbi:MAG: protein-L-isoaspartate(D-aspartate) O-methyltransferase [Rhodospirillales bacterium]|nr:protein-L-isoaspartate(D-aspartate) O-methyltransferase [Rhodospirillales bacterium]MBT4041138.1 protein-L-isoaspartate(D-aspartate) O-methyltransferase [Rhodospirillales bacterium]MBT4626726.1 protein-L-isoaspartate(D-aspartate) O-methyltransferase [Rhodospirillales bacterium]MBT5353135.1 protein-L-isoaspartate(D-aspartate) O-methyltransferase [Rhodospirillales bacterium]MBT5519570.1 protein-L-isoaspartate(D-aspartate) O-methyltransferase [Rhodospirillales bacterium]
MSDSDTAKARLILEVRQGGVTDDTVLRAMESIPRPLFVPQAFQERSFENVALPIGRHQTVSQPVVVGLMTQALDLNDRMKVLEIGTGSGYQAAILSKLCRRLYTMERHPPLLEEAEARFRELRLTNVTAVLADGSMGWKEQAPFDRIMLTAAALDIPAQLVDQLAIGGIMVLPVGLDDSDQRLVKLTKTEDGAETEDLGGVRFVPLLPGVEPE